ncbi:hypothetical protein LFT44_08505 [Arthrobacter sp. FW306-05-C]|uniref:hypothetical protein n=1 Tax=Arthrobacter sp. FW306-05-C TaxID=2879620 RepID=UPI001F36F91D|nr:hypothetical protein [Arthrobacter sp. FW306-05-C]UKA68408.1 hypothetical protein LFT44_08505 [Arthrobacter sp. FW306-05-C]
MTMSTFFGPSMTVISGPTEDFGCPVVMDPQPGTAQTYSSAGRAFELTTKSLRAPYAHEQNVHEDPWTEGCPMWERMVARIRTSVRFPKRSTTDLSWLRNIGIALGILWLAIVLFGWSGRWSGILAVLVGVGWFAQSGLAVKEIRRRQREATLEQPTGQDHGQ